MFLDYNIIFIVTQIAIYPTLPFSTTSIGSFDISSSAVREALVVPTAHGPAAAYWASLGIYGTCSFIWVTIICVWMDLGSGYLGLWGLGGRSRVQAIYIRSA